MDNLLVAGQGLAGTLISYELTKRGVSHTVIDKGHHNNATRAAAGIVNPITGRYFTKSWFYNTLLSTLDQTYQELENLLDISIFKKTNIWRQLHFILDENNWMRRIGDPRYDPYIGGDGIPFKSNPFNNETHTYVDIVNCRQVSIADLIVHYRNYLRERNMLIEESLDVQALQLDEEGVRYGNDRFDAIIFCEGASVVDNPYFNNLPFKPAKGQSLICKHESFSYKNIIKQDIFLAPVQKDLFWTGGRYAWNPEDAEPTKEFQKEYKEKLTQIFGSAVEVVEHRSGIRPCVEDRHPIIGRHTTKPQLILFNGLGTKGTSLGPFFANHLIENLFDNQPLMKEVDILRFQ